MNENELFKHLFHFWTYLMAMFLLPFALIVIFNIRLYFFFKVMITKHIYVFALLLMFVSLTNALYILCVRRL